MQYSVTNSLPGRVRINLQGKIPENCAVALEELLASKPFVSKCTVYPKAGSVSICYVPTSNYSLSQTYDKLCQMLDSISRRQLEQWQPENSLALAPKPRHLFSSLANMTFWHIIRRIFLPQPIKMILRVVRALPFFKAALVSLRAGRLDVPVLDAAAIGIGFLQKDGSGAGSSMYLLHIAETLEDYTQRQSEGSLAQSLLAIPQKARLLEGDTEREVLIDDLQTGQIVVSRTGDAIPVDGEVIAGSAAVNQSSLTGEPLAIIRSVGDSVYAGTSLEEGELIIRITSDPQGSKIRNICSMVEQAESLKSSAQKYIEHLADKLVPWNFLLAALVALKTRNLTKTAAALMVDYSCALKLSGSIAVMTAQREGAKHGFIVKGSRYFEAMAEANVLVLDKTGTLTSAEPTVCGIESFDGQDEQEILRFAACLEEHFPHPVARAVVNKAQDLSLKHRERHAGVEYIVAHGIVSSIDGKRAVIGSEHFVLEDEHVSVNEETLLHIHSKAQGSSPLYLAIDGKLSGVIYVADPVKPGVADTIEELKNLGFSRIIMLTGDNKNTAQLIAKKLGINEYRANLLPEDKHALVCQLQNEGYKVAMIGDGVNDAPALAAAHVSVAMSGSSAVAREAADISLISDDMHALLSIRKLSQALSLRLKQSYRFAVVFNSLLLALGISGCITPQVSAFSHNASTIALSAANTRAYLPASHKNSRQE